MVIERRRIGATEYIIKFKGGAFHVINGNDNQEELCGHLVICEKYLEAKENEYVESLLF